MPKTPTQWTPETKIPTAWAGADTKNPTQFTDADTKTPTAFVNADDKNPTSFQPPLIPQTPYLYTDASLKYTDSNRGYTYLKPSGNQINDKNPTVWSPT